MTAAPALEAAPAHNWIHGDFLRALADATLTERRVAWLERVLGPAPEGGHLVGVGRAAVEGFAALPTAPWYCGEFELWPADCPVGPPVLAVPILEGGEGAREVIEVLGLDARGLPTFGEGAQAGPDHAPDAQRWWRTGDAIDWLGESRVRAAQMDGGPLRLVPTPWEWLTRGGQGATPIACPLDLARCAEDLVGVEIINCDDDAHAEAIDRAVENARRRRRPAKPRIAVAVGG